MNENEYPENPNPYLKSSLIEKLTFRLQFLVKIFYYKIF